MNRLYFILFGIGGMMAAYCAGVANGKTKCHVAVVQNLAQSQSNIIKIQEKVNEETIASATDDIRRVLRKKYTIAE